MAEYTDLFIVRLLTKWWMNNIIINTTLLDLRKDHHIQMYIFVYPLIWSGTSAVMDKR